LKMYLQLRVWSRSMLLRKLMMSYDLQMSACEVLSGSDLPAVSTAA
jgi:hypothetical protein